MSARLRRRQAGSATLELVVIAPGLLLILTLLVVAGRLAVARNSVQDAAAEAARTASLARTAASAQRKGEEAAKIFLQAQGLNCAPTVTVNTQPDGAGSGFTAPVGQDANVAATVTCAVSMKDLARIKGIDSTVTVTAEAVSPLDTYRGRS